MYIRKHYCQKLMETRLSDCDSFRLSETFLWPQNDRSLADLEARIPENKWRDFDGNPDWSWTAGWDRLRQPLPEHWHRVLRLLDDILRFWHFSALLLQQSHWNAPGEDSQDSHNCKTIFYYFFLFNLHNLYSNCSTFVSGHSSSSSMSFTDSFTGVSSR